MTYGSSSSAFASCLLPLQLGVIYVRRSGGRTQGGKGRVGVKGRAATPGGPPAPDCLTTAGTDPHTQTHTWPWNETKTDGMCAFSADEWHHGKMWGIREAVSNTWITVGENKRTHSSVMVPLSHSLGLSITWILAIHSLPASYCLQFQTVKQWQNSSVLFTFKYLQSKQESKEAVTHLKAASALIHDKALSEKDSSMGSDLLFQHHNKVQQSVVRLVWSAGSFVPFR